VYRVGSTPNGVFGAKLMWNNVPWVVDKFTEMDAFAGLTRNDVFTAAFPDLHVVLVTRRDRVRQAVSWARAAQDGVWVVSDAEPAHPAAEPAYDEGLIAAMVGLIEEGERGWRDLCGELGIAPYEVVYENLVAPSTYEATVRGVLAHLDLDVGPAVPAPRTARQADTINEAWVARFLAARGD
jgi:LPS sulfotransferase NodH